MFNIGDKVRCKKDYPVSIDSFNGTGEFMGQSENTENCWAIKRDDGNLNGGAQNGWWNFTKTGEQWLELVNPPHEEYEPFSGYENIVSKPK